MTEPFVEGEPVIEISDAQRETVDPAEKRSIADAANLRKPDRRALQVPFQRTAV
jgi:hypothetical protein